MDLTEKFRELTASAESGGRSFCKLREKRYSPLDDGMSLLTKIHKTKSHLKKHGHNYLNTYGCLPGASIMTDEGRNKMDQDVEGFINICNDKMETLKSEFLTGGESEQVIMHREAAIDIMNKILKNFVQYYHQLRMTRMNRNLEKQRYERIEISSNKNDPDEELENLSLDKINLEVLESITKNDPRTSIDDSSAYNTNHSYSFDDCKEQSLIAAEHHVSISPNEIQTLAFENIQVHEELLTLDDEVKSVSKKVVQLSRLQELFTEKVMEQEIDLNNLHETAIRSSENVREGNDLIRDAMMKNASTRVFILFYIVTLGFTILFLDWYNP